MPPIMPPDAPRFHEKVMDFYGTVVHKKPRKNGALKKPMDSIGLQFGGGGGSRTRVRQPSAYGSTCLVTSMI